MMLVTTKGFGKWLHAAPAGMKCAPLWLSRPLLGGGLPESGSYHFAHNRAGGAPSGQRDYYNGHAKARIAEAKGQGVSVIDQR